MKKLMSILLGALFFFVNASAEEFSWLTFRMFDNSEISVAADGLSITYSDGQLQLSGACVNEKYSVAQIKSMQFTSTAAGLTASLTEGREQTYYTTSGLKAGRFSSIEEAKAALGHGIYIIKNGDKSLKIIF